MSKSDGCDPMGVRKYVFQYYKPSSTGSFHFLNYLDTLPKSFRPTGYSTEEPAPEPKKKKIGRTLYFFRIQTENNLPSGQYLSRARNAKFDGDKPFGLRRSNPVGAWHSIGPNVSAEQVRN